MSNTRIWPPRKVATNSSIKDVLRIDGIDLCFSENGKLFNTSSYELMVKPRPTKRPQQLVVRRGAPFMVRLVCNRAFDPTVDTMVLVFSIVSFANEKPNFGNGTETYVLLHMHGSEEATSSVSEADDWGAVLTDSATKADGKVQLTLMIYTPSYAPVARWKMQFNTRLDTTDVKSAIEVKNLMYILYNPWCEADPVYMEDEASREEYVLDDSTMICKPGPSGPLMTGWNLGQYDPNVLDCALYVISKVGKVKCSRSGDPVAVCRALSGAVHSANGSGVLRGNWSGNYEGGTSPLSWTGSVKILQEFYETQETVQFGQCWVFAGVQATLCRALGIPCRIITNFQSAGDHDSSLTVDFYLDNTDTVDSGLTVDSIWNFHVWNEAWMQRKDLQKKDYDGWQAVDATPQQLSDGMFKCGPFPVEAVKRGQVHLPYDGEFVYAEVNADLIYWSVGNDQNPPKPIQIKTQGIGLDISTKAVGSDRREDVTQWYKHPEGSKEERDIMNSAKEIYQRFSTSGLSKRLLADIEHANREKEDMIMLELECDEELRIGSAFQIELHVTARGSPVNVSGNVLVKDSDYTGRYTRVLSKVPFAAHLDAEESKTVLVPLEFKDYFTNSTNKTHLKATVVANVEGYERTYFSIKDFHLTAPTIEMTVLDHSAVGPLAVQVKLSNPLPVPLTDGHFVLEGSRFMDPIEKQYDTIPIGGSVQFVYPINLSHKGKMVISASFVSNELRNVYGHITINAPTTSISDIE